MAFRRSHGAAGHRMPCKVHSRMAVFGKSASEAPETYPQRATCAPWTLHAHAANAQAGKADPICNAPAMRHISGGIESGCNCCESGWEGGVHPQVWIRKYPTLVVETFGGRVFETTVISSLSGFGKKSGRGVTTICSHKTRFSASPIADIPVRCIMPI